MQQANSHLLRPRFYHSPPSPPPPQHRLRSLGSTGGGEEGPGAAKVTLGGEKRAAREEAITLPITGDMALLGLGELFPTFPTQARPGRGLGRGSVVLRWGGRAGGELRGTRRPECLPNSRLPPHPTHPPHPQQGPSLSQGPTSSGLFVMPSLPEGTASEAGTSGRQKGNRRSRRGAAGEAAEKGGGGGLLLGRAEEGEVALHLEGLPHHGLELM